MGLLADWRSKTNFSASVGPSRHLSVCQISIPKTFPRKHYARLVTRSRSNVQTFKAYGEYPHVQVRDRQVRSASIILNLLFPIL